MPLARCGCELARSSARVCPGFEGGTPTACRGAEGNGTCGGLRVGDRPAAIIAAYALPHGARPRHGGDYSGSPAPSRFVLVLPAPHASAQAAQSANRQRTTPLRPADAARALLPLPIQKRGGVRTRRCNSSNREETRRLELAPARAVRPTALNPLAGRREAGDQQTTSASYIGAGAAPEFTPKRNRDTIGTARGPQTTPRCARLANSRCGATRELRLAIAPAPVLRAMVPWPLVARMPRRTVHARLLDRGSVRWNATTGRRALRLSGRSDSPQPEPSR